MHLHLNMESVRQRVNFVFCVNIVVADKSVRGAVIQCGMLNILVAYLICCKLLRIIVWFQLVHEIS